MSTKNLPAPTTDPLTGAVIVDGVVYMTQADMGGTDWYAEMILDEPENDVHGWVRPVFVDRTGTERPWRGRVERDADGAVTGEYADDYAGEYGGLDVADVPAEPTHHAWVANDDTAGTAVDLADAIAACVRATLAARNA